MADREESFANETSQAHGESWAGGRRPDFREVDRVIASAKKHPLGLDFLLEGDLGSVAVTFGAHAFAVEAARNRLRRATR